MWGTCTTSSGLEKRAGLSPKKKRASAPLMVPLGARVINNSELTSDQTSGLIISEVKKRLGARE